MASTWQVHGKYMASMRCGIWGKTSGHVRETCLHVLAHVEAHHGALRAIVCLSDSLGKLRLTDTGWSGEEHAGDGSPRVAQPDTRAT